MSKKNLYLFALIMWVLCTLVWDAHIFVDFYYGVADEGLVVMHIITAVASFIATIATYIRYKKYKE